MKVVLDSTIPLNVYLHGIKGMQRPMPVESARVMAAPLLGKMEAYMTPTAYSNVYYFLQKYLPLVDANASARDVLQVVTVIPQTKGIFLDALASGWADVEDAGQYLAAQAFNGITHICTNDAGYPATPGIAVVNPAALLSLL
ncbi:MAG: hypothetical protein JSS84_09525 [Bacteroidetes bacterium]|nr:hypothetical protein [Bacteroidota bacterium]